MSPKALPYILNQEELWLLPQKAIWYPKYQSLILSDVHLGKTGHFRKAGIAIPKEVAQEDLATLSDLIEQYSPKQIIFLGDLFHSEINNDWQWFSLWRELHHRIKIILVKGNHDILPPIVYAQLRLTVVDFLEMGSFTFIHEPVDINSKTESYTISGHIHPGVCLRGKGRQFLNLPCFYFGAQQAILPAFGKFTGLAILKINATDKVFAVTPQQIMVVKDGASCFPS
jgi:DNA ligase-associated metallophosphoesterase